LPLFYRPSRGYDFMRLLRYYKARFYTKPNHRTY
jgi:hypothetical protein